MYVMKKATGTPLVLYPFTYSEIFVLVCFCLFLFLAYSLFLFHIFLTFAIDFFSILNLLLISL